MELSVRTATGKEFEVQHCVETMFGMQSLLYIEFIGAGMMDIVPVFSDAHETATIYGCVDGDVSKTYTGHTVLAEAFVVPENGNLRIRLDVPASELGE